MGEGVSWRQTSQIARQTDASPPYRNQSVSSRSRSWSACSEPPRSVIERKNPFNACTTCSSWRSVLRSAGFSCPTCAIECDACDKAVTLHSAHACHALYESAPYLETRCGSGNTRAGVVGGKWGGEERRGSGDGGAGAAMSVAPRGTRIRLQHAADRFVVERVRRHCALLHLPRAQLQ